MFAEKKKFSIFAIQQNGNGNKNGNRNIGL